MSETETFSGFSREALSFFRELSRNNNREWFAERKTIYNREVLDPAQSFVEQLGKRLTTLSDTLKYDTRTSGSGSILKIYRDVRFSRDKSPYNPYLRIVFWTGGDKKSEGPALYFRLDHTEARLYAGMHDFSSAVLPLYRERAAGEETGAELERVIAAIRRAGAYELGGLHYKRVPAGFDQDHPRAELLKHNGLYAVSPGIETALVTSSGLVGRCVEHARTMMPLVDWLQKLVSRLSVG
jgi:uncharacterized protein (TIGR02453 family)